MQHHLDPGSPYQGPRGRGGIYNPTSTGDPFFDQDWEMPQRIMDLATSLSEHPGVRPHLERYMLCYGQRAGDEKVVLCCTRCNESPCVCEDLGIRSKEYMVAVFNDPELRPLFAERHLAVRER